MTIPCPAPWPRAGGLRFEAYLAPALADWLLERIERGMFADPSEAVFAIVGNFRDLEPHRDLRDALLRRLLQAAADDPARLRFLEFFAVTIRNAHTRRAYARAQRKAATRWRAPPGGHYPRAGSPWDET